MPLDASAICEQCENFASILCPLVATSTVWIAETVAQAVAIAKYIEWRTVIKPVGSIVALAMPMYILLLKQIMFAS